MPGKADNERYETWARVRLAKNCEILRPRLGYGHRRPASVRHAVLMRSIPNSDDFSVPRFLVAPAGKKINVTVYWNSVNFQPP